MLVLNIMLGRDDFFPVRKNKSCGGAVAPPYFEDQQWKVKRFDEDGEFGGARRV